MEAVEQENLKCIDFLLLNNADPNVSDAFGETALFHAIRSKSKFKFQMSDLLIKSHSNVNFINSFGVFLKGFTFDNLVAFARESDS